MEELEAIEPTDRERERAAIFAGGMLCDHLVYLCRGMGNETITPHEVDVYIRNNICICDLSEDDYAELYLEHAADLVAQMAHRLDPESNVTGMSISSNVLGVALSHTLHLEGVPLVGLIEPEMLEPDEEVRVPSEWL